MNARIKIQAKHSYIFIEPLIYQEVPWDKKKLFFERPGQEVRTVKVKTRSNFLQFKKNKFILKIFILWTSALRASVLNTGFVFKFENNPPFYFLQNIFSCKCKTGASGRVINFEMLVLLFFYCCLITEMIFAACELKKSEPTKYKTKRDLEETFACLFVWRWKPSNAALPFGCATVQTPLFQRFQTQRHTDVLTNNAWFKTRTALIHLFFDDVPVFATLRTTSCMWFLRLWWTPCPCV